MNHVLLKARRAARKRLIEEMIPDGSWEGRLSSSALATAIAVFALAQVDRHRHAEVILSGTQWIAGHANADGGWGDSPDSPSNLTATLLCRCALSLFDSQHFRTVADGAASWISDAMGDLRPLQIAEAVIRSYGEDRTFSAPILTMCALAGQLGPDPWERVPQLPFELAVIPRWLFRFMRLSVVSYAIPALIAVGLARHRRLPGHGPVRHALRNIVTRRALKILQDMQPRNGGFLEAAPLTGFVAMGLAAAGLGDHPVTRRGEQFLLAGVRNDGSWSIDTDLSTWVTALSVNALAFGDRDALRLSGQQSAMVRSVLLGRQHTRSHAFTHAAAGGWAWTGLPGAVPDADDTAGVLLAMKALGPVDNTTREAATAGVQWLMNLQNADGGIPTFCKGWNRLPFDRSCPDISAHALRTLDAWCDELDARLQSRINQSMNAIVVYLASVQRHDGSWIPLWFGNQRAPQGENATYGTAQTVVALREIVPDRLPDLDPLIVSGSRWLLGAQNSDGGWGGAPGVVSSIEETSLAVSALAGLGCHDAVRRGTEWLIEITDEGRRFPSSPVGLYFAGLWYSEELYPLIFAVQALSRAAQLVHLTNASHRKS